MLWMLQHWRILQLVFCRQIIIFLVVISSNNRLLAIFSCKWNARRTLRADCQCNNEAGMFCIQSRNTFLFLIRKKPYQIWFSNEFYGTIVIGIVCRHMTVTWPGAKRRLDVCRRLQQKTWWHWQNSTPEIHTDQRRQAPLERVRGVPVAPPHGRSH